MAGVVPFQTGQFFHPLHGSCFLRGRFVHNVLERFGQLPQLQLATSSRSCVLHYVSSLQELKTLRCTKGAAGAWCHGLRAPGQVGGTGPTCTRRLAQHSTPAGNCLSCGTAVVFQKVSATSCWLRLRQPAGVTHSWATHALSSLLVLQRCCDIVLNVLACKTEKHVSDCLRQGAFASI